MDAAVRCCSTAVCFNWMSCGWRSLPFDEMLGSQEAIMQQNATFYACPYQQHRWTTFLFVVRNSVVRSIYRTGATPCWRRFLWVICLFSEIEHRIYLTSVWPCLKTPTGLLKWTLSWYTSNVYQTATMSGSMKPRQRWNAFLQRFQESFWASDYFI